MGCKHRQSFLEAKMLTVDQQIQKCAMICSAHLRKHAAHPRACAMCLCSPGAALAPATSILATSTIATSTLATPTAAWVTPTGRCGRLVHCP